MEYTPLQAGQAAAFGTSGQPVMDLQTQLNTQNAGKPGWTPLLVDGLYGPKTKAATGFQPNPGPGIVSTFPIRNEFNQYSSLLDQLDMNDPYRMILAKKLGGGVDPQEQMEISNATAKAKRAGQQEIQRADEYEAGLRTSGIQGGSARYTPELFAGSIDQAHRAETIRLAELQDAEELAIANAKRARAERDQKAFKEAVDYAKEIRKEKATQLANEQKMKWEREKFYTIHGKGGSGGGHYTAKNIPSDLKSQIFEDLGDASTTLLDLYNAYPDVNSDYLSDIYKSLRSGEDSNPFD